MKLYVNASNNNISKCMKCHKNDAEIYISDYDGYLCDDCYSAYFAALEKFRNDFILGKLDKQEE